MKLFTTFFLFFHLIIVSAQEISLEFEMDFSLSADTFIGVDTFENYYYVKNNTFYKKNGQQIFTYTNTQLGKITSIDITNPLKILLFYRGFNTILFLDNRLNELSTPINFTTLSFSKNISFVSVSSNNNLWVYSNDDSVLRLWNHQTKKVQFTSQPISFYQSEFKVLQQFSSYRICWLIGKDAILKFNEYGTFLKLTKIKNFINIKPFNDGYLYVKDGSLYYQNNKMDLLKIQSNIKVDVKNYTINLNHIYIFDGTKIFVFKIIKK